MLWTEVNGIWTRTAICVDCRSEYLVQRPAPTRRIPTRCSDCVRAKNRAKQYAWREANPDAWKVARDRAHAKRMENPEYRRRKREAERRRIYGMAPTEYQSLADAQNGLCAICGRPPRGRANGRSTWPDLDPRLHVDHDHDTGAIRGLLCSNCNTMLGLAGDDPAVLQSAMEYLRRE